MVSPSPGLLGKTVGPRPESVWKKYKQFKYVISIFLAAVSGAEVFSSREESRSGVLFGSGDVGNVNEC